MGHINMNINTIHDILYSYFVIKVTEVIFNSPIRIITLNHEPNFYKSYGCVIFIMKIRNAPILPKIIILHNKKKSSNNLNNLILVIELCTK